jgi:4-amino-4-deoxy-L-arabinose transferase-like glycosyltransferase
MVLWSRVFKRLLLVLAVLAVTVYGVGLADSSIWDANEAFYVETPREMIERGDYINPTFNYEPRINKPVLSYWVVAGLYQIVGVSVGAERVAIAAAALTIMAAAFALARVASPHAAAPILALLGLAANPRFFLFGRRILVDVLLAAFMTLTLLFFALAERYPHRRRLFLLLMYVSGGLGLLTKGPVAAALPALAFLAYLIHFGELRRLRTFMIPTGAVVALAIVAPWYMALHATNGWEPIRSFLVGENIDRFVSGAGGLPRGPFFYLPVIFSDSLPWSLLLPAAVWAWFRERRDSSVDPSRRIRTLLIYWVLVIVTFFSFSTTKQDLYILPIVAAVSVLGADILARGAMTPGRAPFAGVQWGLRAAGLLLACAGAFMAYVFQRAGAAYALNGAVALGVLGIAGGLTTTWLAGRRTGWAAVALTAALVSVNWTLTLRVLPDFERYKPVVPLSETILRHIEPGDRVVQYDMALPSMVFYLQRRVEILDSRETFLATLRESGRIFAIMSEERYEAVKAELGPAACIVERRTRFDLKLREMLDRRPPPAIVLVNTRCG